MCFCCNFTPTCTSRYKEDTLRSIFVDILLESIAFFNKFLMLIIKSIGDILQKNQSQNNVLIF